MLGHHISIGYNPSGDPEAQWLFLVDQARRISDHPYHIEVEARRLGCPLNGRFGECLTGYAENYRGEFGGFDHPVSIVGEGEDRQVMQLASTDGGDIKYHVRRAFVRLLVEAMHRAGIEISVIAA